jgi:D-alanine-D-alanine ligase
MHKTKAKIVLAHAGVPTPAWRAMPVSWPLEDAVREASAFAAESGYPLVIKPAESGSSFGVSIARSSEDLPAALRMARQEGGENLAEEWIAGRELSCGVLGNSDEGRFEPLPVTEIIPKGDFFDYENKYTPGHAREVTPAEVDDAITKEVQRLSVLSHEALGCDGLSRVDMILRQRELFVLEVNTIPGMTETSLCPQQARAAGMSFADLLDRMIDLALRRKRAGIAAIESSRGS